MIQDGTVRVAYEPRTAFQPFHQRSNRFACMVAHRRAGKTVASVNEIVGRAIYCTKKRPRYAYVGPLLKQAKKIAWEYLKEYTAGLELKKPSESELSVILRHNKAEIGIYGADNPDAFRGQYFDGIVLDEYGDMSPSVWNTVLLPTLNDRKGWAVFIGTFKGKNHFYKIYRRSCGLDLLEGENPEYFKKNWFSLILPADKSGILDPEEMELHRMEMDEEEYRQEYLCDPNAVVKGTYYAKLLAKLEAEGKIYADVDWEPDQPVEAIFDLGYTDSTAIWYYQRRPGGLAIIDYDENHGQPLSFYFNLLESKGYEYRTVWLPHDARAKSLQTGRSTVEQFAKQGFPICIAPNLQVQDGISAVRKILPMCYFHKKTEHGVEALRAYKRDYNEDRQVFSDQPLHDWSSHGSDAFRYLALVAQDIQVAEEPPKVTVKSAKLQLEILFQERERKMSRVRNRI